MKKLIVVLLVFCMLSYVAAAEVGTMPKDFSVSKAAQSDLSVLADGLQPVVNENGKISWSIDGLGSNDGTGLIQVQKPAGATIRKAYMAAASTGWSYYHITNSDITIEGSPITWGSETASSIYSYNYWSDVTSLVKPTLDAASVGNVDLTVTESNAEDIDGVILVVIFDDPNQVNANTVILSFGAQNIAGDTFAIGLADPLDKSAPGFALDMSLGISFGYQGFVDPEDEQYSIVQINSQRLTTSAGGQDDGADENGALITVGGIGDSNANPADPNAEPTEPRSDDELYNLIPFVNNGDVSIDAYTQNPSNDDNIFFAGFFLGSTTAVSGEGILLSPSYAANILGEQHTLTATVQDVTGSPVVGVSVKFLVTSGPNAGLTSTVATDVDGKAYFSYTSDTEGTDVIQASFQNQAEEWIFSNEVEKEWSDNEIPEFTVIGALIAAIAIAGLLFFKRK